MGGEAAVIRATLDRLREELDAANAGRNEYVLFGSAVLWLHGLRDEVGDVDVFVSRGVWGDWLTLGWDVLTPRAGDPPLLELVVPGGVCVHAFYAWAERDAWVSADECFAQAESVPDPSLAGTWRCAPLSLIRSHKLGAHAANPGSARHAKHLADVRAIDGAASAPARLDASIAAVALMAFVLLVAVTAFAFGVGLTGAP